MDTCNLEGGYLDYWVAIAAGHTLSSDGNSWDWSHESVEDGIKKINFFSCSVHRWRPSTEWRIGGLIIEGQQMCVYHSRPQQTWVGGSFKDGGGTVQSCGSTALIAAMRTYVTAKIGPSVPAYDNQPGVRLY